MTTRLETPKTGGKPTSKIQGESGSTLAHTIVQDRTRWAIPVLSVAGMLISAYLTWVKLANVKAMCAGIGNCDTVQTSRYSAIGGIPVAALGFGVYAVLLLVSVYGPRLPIKNLAAYVPLIVFGIALTGVLFSAYLTYLELTVIHAICPWCVLSAIILTFILGFSVRGLSDTV